MKSSQDKLGEMPIGRLLIVMSVPMMISMLVQALYNLVDSMFVAQISENALTAVSLAFPMQALMNAVAVGTGVGVSAYVSRSLGQGDSESASRAASIQMVLSLIYSVLALAVGLGFSRSFYLSQTDVPEIVDQGEIYLRTVCVFSFGIFYGQNLEKLLVATGSSALSMISQATGAVVNIALDPVLIFGLGPFPKLGVYGAALATVIGQFLAAVLALIFNLSFNKAARFSLRLMRPDRRVLAGVYSVGIPSMITVGLASITSFCLNQILLGFSTTAAAVYGIWIKMQSFGFMPVYGLNNGTIAIYSYNYGAGRTDRLRRTLRLALFMGIGITLLISAAFELLPGEMLALFKASDYMYSIGIGAMRVCAMSLPFGAACIILASPCQSLGRPGYTLFINICRQVLIQVPAAWLLARTGELGAIWYSVIIAEVLTTVIASCLTASLMRRIEKNG